MLTASSGFQPQERHFKTERSSHVTLFTSPKNFCQLSCLWAIDEGWISQTFNLLRLMSLLVNRSTSSSLAMNHGFLRVLLCSLKIWPLSSPVSRRFAVVMGNAFSSIIRSTEEGRELPSCQQLDFLCGVSSRCEDHSVRLPHVHTNKLIMCF